MLSMWVHVFILVQESVYDVHK